MGWFPVNILSVLKEAKGGNINPFLPNTRIRSEYRKIRTRKTQNTDTFAQGWVKKEMLNVRDASSKQSEQLHNLTLHNSGAYLGPRQTSLLELFAKIFNAFSQLTIFLKSSIIDN